MSADRKNAINFVLSAIVILGAAWFGARWGAAREKALECAAETREAVAEFALKCVDADVAKYKIRQEELTKRTIAEVTAGRAYNVIDGAKDVAGECVAAARRIYCAPKK